MSAHRRIARIDNHLFASHRLPRSGDELTINGFRVVVERVVKRRVERVYFERLAKTARRAAR